MIGFTHIEVLRGQIAEKERELAGWRYLLAHAESVERADQAAQLPDPLLGVGTPWPIPAPEMLWRPPVEPVNGRDPYPAGQGASVYDGTLPPKQEDALGLLASEHAAYAQTPKARDEEQEWRQA